MKIGIFDAITGENIVREMTKEELDAKNAEIAEFAAAKKAKEEAEAALKQTKVTAYEKLGLTVQEISAILPQ
jgi:hypothetical protein